MNRLACIATLLILPTPSVVRAQKPPLLPEKDVAALANELSGETAKRDLEGIARFHRQRGSKGFHEAAELVSERLRAYGLSDVAILQFPADGKIFYGTQRSRPAWDVEKGELWQVAQDFGPCERAETQKRDEAERRKQNPTIRIARDCVIETKINLLASYEAQPVVLAEDSESAEVTTELVDVGAGTKESDYAGKDVKENWSSSARNPAQCRISLLANSAPAGIISYAQNQKTAWSGENQEAIRWGHLETFSPNKTFAFMVSLQTAHGFQERLSKGEKITLRATVKAGQHPGNYEVVTATIPGSDRKLRDEEIVFSCHLDHQRPGANDNASGCATILEVARALQKLIADRRLAAPARTVRFVFPPEIEGTMALLNGKPEFAKRIKAVIHMDMVGGGPETKSVFHVTRGPMSLPSFVHDVAWAFADWLNDQSYQYAATGEAAYAMIAPEGGKEPLRSEYSAYTMGSDHDVYQDSSFGIPAIYLNDWPDRFIHTNFDSAANIDPTKLKRAAFIGAASGYYFAAARNVDAMKQIDAGQIVRSVVANRRAEQLSDEESGNLNRVLVHEELEIIRSLTRLTASYTREGIIESLPLRMPNIGPPQPKPPQGDGLLRLKRKPEPKGPLTVFGYDYLSDHAKSAGIAIPKLLEYQGLWGSGEEYAYEVLNFADGKRNAQQIRDAVSAEYGPVSLDLVLEYLRALEKIGLVEQVKDQPKQPQE